MVKGGFSSTSLSYLTCYTRVIPSHPVTPHGQTPQTRKQRENPRQSTRQATVNHPKVASSLPGTVDRRPWQSEAMKLRWADPEYRESRRQATRELWNSPEYRAKQSAARESEDYLNKMRSQGLHNETCRENLTSCRKGK